MRGISLVKAFLAEHRTDMPRLFNRSTNPKRVAIRAKLIRHLDDNGLSAAEISRVLDIDRHTVLYWLNEELRRKKMNARAVNHGRQKIYLWWDECAKAMECRA